MIPLEDFTDEDADGDDEDDEDRVDTENIISLSHSFTRHAKI